MSGEQLTLKSDDKNEGSEDSRTCPKTLASK